MEAAAAARSPFFVRCLCPGNDRRDYGSNAPGTRPDDKAKTLRRGYPRPIAAGKPRSLDIFLVSMLRPRLAAAYTLVPFKASCKAAASSSRRGSGIGGVDTDAGCDAGSESRDV